MISKSTMGKQYRWLVYAHVVVGAIYAALAIFLYVFDATLLQWRGMFFGIVIFGLSFGWLRRWGILLRGQRPHR